MKQFLVIIIILFSENAFSSVNNHQKTITKSSFDSLEVFLSITYNNISTANQVKSAIIALSGTSYLAYCSNHAVFMVYIDQNVYATKKDFLDHLLKSVPQGAQLLSIKEGGFKDLVDNCISLDATESDAVKTKFGR